MLRLLTLGTGLGILVAASVVHGMWTQRWRPSQELQAAATRLAQVPLQVGHWQGRDELIEPAVVERSGLAACWTRRYTHERSGRGVTVVLMCGRAGPTSVHTPEWCYGGAGYERTGTTLRYVVEQQTAAPAEFWAADFLQENPAVPAHLRIFWGWSADGTWSAPNYPRLSFAGREALFKLYVLRETSADGRPLSSDPCVEFLRAVLPVLERTLFQGSTD